MPNLNECLFMGNITRDPELSYTPGQVAVIKFGLAINKKWKDQSGNQKEKVCFIDCVAFAKTAEVIGQYVKKGDPIFVRGELDFQQWTAQDGSKRSKHAVNVNSFQFLTTGSKPVNAAPAPQQSQQPDQPPPPDDSDIPF